MKRKKFYRPDVLFVVNCATFFKSHRYHLIIELIGKGYDVHLAVPQSDLLDEFRENGISCHVIPFERSGHDVGTDLKTFFLLIKLFLRLKPRLIHLVSIKPILYGGIAARLVSKGSVVTAFSGLGTLFLSSSFLGKLRRKLVFWPLAIALAHPRGLVVCQNDDDATLLCTQGLTLRERCRIIRGSGIMMTEYSVTPEPAGVPIVVLAARLIRDKGILEYFEAAEILAKRGEKIRFKLAGSLDFENLSCLSREEFEGLLRKGYVEYLGFSSNVSELYSNANIICLPSYREGLPRSLIEGAACGRAIVATDVPGCRDIVSDGVTGLLAQPGDPISLANAIMYLASNEAVRHEMGRQARMLAEARFDIKVIVECHVSIYAELIA